LRVAVKTRVPLTAEVAAALGAYGVVRHRLWRLDVAEMSVEAADLARLAASERVARVELDERVSAASIESALPADLTAGVSTWGLDLIDVSDSATGARVVSETGAGVHVAVLDTGLVGAWRDFFPEERIDQEHATAFLGGANERSPWDDKGHAANPDRIWEHATYSHGTHVTGTILGFHVGAPYDVELAGVAPRAVVIPIKVLGQNGYGSNLDIVAALYYLGWLRETGAVTRAPRGQPQPRDRSSGGDPRGSDRRRHRPRRHRRRRRRKRGPGRDVVAGRLPAGHLGGRRGLEARLAARRQSAVPRRRRRGGGRGEPRELRGLLSAGAPRCQGRSST
jgi:hypothetical protein